MTLKWQPSDHPTIWLFDNQQECETGKGTFYVYRSDNKLPWNLTFISKRQFVGDRKWYTHTSMPDEDSCKEYAQHIYDNYDRIKPQETKATP